MNKSLRRNSISLSQKICSARPISQRAACKTVKCKYLSSMKVLFRFILISFFSLFASIANGEEKQSKEIIMSATGMFEVSLDPQNDEDAPVGRMIIDKKYSGALVGTGIGQMISKRTESGAAVYSAIEEFEGLLEGKKGTFTLVHYGEMSAAGQKLEVNIIAGSGSGELENISGSMEIIQENKTHRYVLKYKL